VVVIPAVDLHLGTVTIMAKQGTERFRHENPGSIAHALAQAVQPTRWCGLSRTLTVTVAAAGRSQGLQRHFALRHEDPA